MLRETMLHSSAVERDDLDTLFEYGLTRHLDGLAALIDDGRETPTSQDEART